jgi:S-adenosylmethionine hydrolase
MRIITLTTDFGTDDWFVGTMKGVIASILGKTTAVDISHAAEIFARERLRSRLVTNIFREEPSM